METVLHQLLQEVNTKNRHDVVDTYYRILCTSPKEIPKIDSFYRLPLKNILEIVSKFDFYEMDQKEVLNIVLDIIKNTIDNHSNEEETLFLLNRIPIDIIEPSYDDCIQILSCFTNCVTCARLALQVTFPDIDYDLQIQERDIEIRKNVKEINDLKKQIANMSPSETQKPEKATADIFSACKHGNLESVRYLIENEGYSPLKKNSDGSTLLHIAVSSNRLDIIKYLIEVQKVDPNIHGFFGYTPLHIAAYCNFLDAVKYLIEKAGADKNAINQSGNMPIHNAATDGRLEIVKYLVEKAHVDINSKGNYQMTPLHCASYKGHINVVKYLVSKGADKHALTTQNKTPADVACDWCTDKSKADTIRQILK